MKIKTRRWNDPAQKDDGTRILVCRYRPRALRKEDETWDEWHPELGPSRELHADFWGKHGPPLGWSEYERRYRRQMRGRRERDLIAGLAARAVSGEVLTLLCSSACADPAHCHRTILAELVGKAARSDRIGSPYLRRSAGPIPDTPSRSSSVRG